jgi:hypothetical protein
VVLFEVARATGAWLHSGSHFSSFTTTVRVRPLDPNDNNAHGLVVAAWQPLFTSVAPFLILELGNYPKFYRSEVFHNLVHIAFYYENLALLAFNFGIVVA